MKIKILYSVLTILMTAFCSIEAEALPEKIEVISSNTVDQPGEEEYQIGLKCLMDPNFKTSRAFSYFQTAVEEGHVRAHVFLGSCYLLGIGVKQNNQEGIQWIRTGAELGDPNAQWTLALYTKLGVSGLTQNANEAFHWFKKAAEAGHNNAQYNVGLGYELGEGVAQNDKESFFWYKKAADQGYQYAQYKLGIYCEEGRGVDQDVNEAIKWYKKAAAQGHSASQTKLEELIAQE
ncbi:MAG TPA: tetratricopeptide repeat protein [Rhabdochlamydiaceae bacterium]|nr:tetratricopeptide repeat protein [Rhabdochlamydiaceae bacterium]